jgi:hypothetical protein
MDESAASFNDKQKLKEARRHHLARVSMTLGLVRVSNLESLKDLFEHERLNVAI